MSDVKRIDELQSQLAAANAENERMKSQLKACRAGLEEIRQDAQKYSGWWSWNVANEVLKSLSVASSPPASSPETCNEFWSTSEKTLAPTHHCTLPKGHSGPCEIEPIVSSPSATSAAALEKPRPLTMGVASQMPRGERSAVDTRTNEQVIQDAYKERSAVEEAREAFASFYATKHIANKYIVPLENYIKALIDAALDSASSKAGKAGA